MDHMKILKRAWHIITRYRALWAFGIILALTTVSWGQSTLLNNSGSSGDQPPPSSFEPEEKWLEENLPELQSEVDALEQSVQDILGPDPLRTVITMAVAATCIVLVLIILMTIARYVSETALIKMVDQYENTGEPSSVRQGFRMGWSRAAWRIFLINLLVAVTAISIFMLALLLAASPLLLLITGNLAISIIAGVAAAGLFFLVIFMAIIAGEAVRLIQYFAHRACALSELGVIDALHQGYNVVRQHLKDVVLMWLIVLGIRIGWPIVMMPIGVLVLVVAVIVGLIIAIPTALIAGLFMSLVGQLLTAAFTGAIVFVLILAIPLTFLDGLRIAFLSSTWTLTYRELRSLDDLALGPAELETATAE
ncbi:MAG: hypothetical protein JXB30_18200 [Anaerolineae bacterium]|nr:hypothetical protein [Anaerolineae bacterium]